MRALPRRALALAGLVALAADPALAQCAMCKTVLEGSPEGLRVASDLNRAILLMFLAPYLVFGSFVVTVFRGTIRAWLAAHSLWPPPWAAPSRRA